MGRGPSPGRRRRRLSAMADSPLEPRAARPVVLVVEDDDDAPRPDPHRARAALRQRLPGDLRGLGRRALERLERMRSRAEQVALVLATSGCPSSPARSCSRVPRRSTRRPSVPCSWTSAPGASARPPRRCCDRWRSGEWTTTSSSPGAAPTSSSIARSPSSCTSGTGPAPRCRRSWRSSASRGPCAVTSCVGCSRATGCRTACTPTTPRRDGGCWPTSATRAPASRS